jgi:hypothetical protein
VVFGRRPGQRVKADRFAPKVLKLVGEGQSYREISNTGNLNDQHPLSRFSVPLLPEPVISHQLGLSKNTVLDNVKRDRTA